MAAVLAPLIVAAGLIGYLVVTTQLAVYRRIPWEFLAVSVAGAALGMLALWRRPGVGTGASALLSTAVLGFAAWYILSYSMYGQREDRPRVGDTFPDFTLTTSSGKLFSLAAATGRRHLIVLYRGDW